MRNNAIGCAILLAVIEGVGIAFGRMMAENTYLLEVTRQCSPESLLKRRSNSLHRRYEVSVRRLEIMVLWEERQQVVWL